MSESQPSTSDIAIFKETEHQRKLTALTQATQLTQSHGLRRAAQQALDIHKLEVKRENAVFQQLSGKALEMVYQALLHDQKFSAPETRLEADFLLEDLNKILHGVYDFSKERMLQSTTFSDVLLHPFNPWVTSAMQSYHDGLGELNQRFQAVFIIALMKRLASINTEIQELKASISVHYESLPLDNAKRDNNQQNIDRLSGEAEELTRIHKEVFSQYRQVGGEGTSKPD